jgi:SAM-dependent methyltransferase
MASDWFATHAAGFGPLVLRLASRDVEGFAEPRSDDSSIRFSRGVEFERSGPPVAVLSYCRSLFRVLAETRGGLAEAARLFAADPSLEARIGSVRLGRAPVAGPGRGPATFVLRGFGPDDPGSIPLESRRGIEVRIGRATGMRPDSARPDREYRLQERSDGRTLFLERIDSLCHSGNSSRRDDSLRSGELPRTTCRLLAEMTEPKPDDVFLDPFCGYGGIVFERVLAAPYRFAFASDTDAERIADVKRELSTKAFEKRRKTFFPKVRDALDSSAFEAGFVTAIATDPPWGLFEGGMGGSEAEELLGSFMAEAERLLAPGGRLVLLVSRALADRAFGDAAARPALFSGSGGAFVRRESLDVLVSGKKARALRFDRTRVPSPLCPGPPSGV